VQNGPFVASHAAPSAAGATHVPVMLPVARLHVAPARHPTNTLLTMPHVCPAATSGCIAHMFVDVLHVRPAAASQLGAVMVRASQVAPTVAPSAMQAPIVVMVAPTHASPWMHGRSREHAPPSVTGAWQVIVVATQLSVGPQPWFAHDVPATGAVAHVPQSEPGGVAQKLEWHCAAYEQVEPSEPGPIGGMHPAGGVTPERYAGHVSDAVSPPHVSSWVGLFAVFGAASACAQASFSRATQVARSVQRRSRSVGEQLFSLLQLSWASAVHA
jgi:hypothetical protein